LHDPQDGHWCEDIKKPHKVGDFNIFDVFILSFYE
jgi:hypothetical protein